MIALNRRPASLLVVGALALALSGPAEGAEPLPLNKRPVPTAKTPVTENRTPPAATEVDPAKTPAPPPAMQFQQLDSPGLASLGTLTPTEAALDATPWTGTSPAAAQRMIDALPQPTDSAAVNDLVRRLLLVAAPLPSAPDETAAESHFAVRVAALRRLGYLDEALALLARVPAGQRRPTHRRQSIEIAFLIDALATACPQVRRAQASSEDLFWLRAGIVCDTADKRLQQVELNLTLLAELDAPENPFIEAATAFLTGEKISRPADRALDPPTLAMVRLGGGALTAEFGDELTGDLRTALLRSESTPYQLRLALAEQAAGWGQISGGDLRALYQNITVGEDQLDNVLAVAKTEADAHASGLLFRAAEAQGSDVTRAMYIDHAITLARSRGTMQATGGPLAELVGAMTPASHLQWFTPTAVEILIAGGKSTAIDPWRQLARRRDAEKEDTRQRWARVRPLAYLAATTAPPWDSAMMPDWQAAAKANFADKATARRVQLTALLEAVGAPLDGAVWPATTVDAAMVADHYALRRRLQNAAEAGRVGETILLTAILLGQAPLAKSATADVVTAITALMAIDQTAAGRALALEAALARGL